MDPQACGSLSHEMFPSCGSVVWVAFDHVGLDLCHETECA